ncbi:uncharacterized protein LOC126747391 [Anthonomus grandis grandis]|uniref:uncharacterized protein LOC126747391 n=1 Tax=Anthonomus grandis grandis TaxID=2921223 RepID=UPI0021666918|nr:uncharacterized protein LOC126747391 [Anthonomus grandis grandis]
MPPIRPFNCSDNLCQSFKLDSVNLKRNEYASNCLSERFLNSRTRLLRAFEGRAESSRISGKFGLDGKQGEISVKTYSKSRISRNYVGHRKLCIFPTSEKGTFNKKRLKSHPDRQDLELGHSKKITGKAKFRLLHNSPGKIAFKVPSESGKHSARKSKTKELSNPFKSLGRLHVVARDLQETRPLLTFRETVNITADASDIGWGAHINGRLISGIWDINQRFWHINKKELYAVLRTFQLELHILKNKRVLVQSDNKTVVAYIRNQGGTRASLLTEMVSCLLEMCQEHQIDIVPQFIPGVYNDIADSLSRQKHLADWHLSEKVTRLIFVKWGTPEVDLFATRKSRVVQNYVSRDVKDSMALFTDAFSRA